MGAVLFSMRENKEDDFETTMTEFNETMEEFEREMRQFDQMMAEAKELMLEYSSEETSDVEVQAGASEGFRPATSD